MSDVNPENCVTAEEILADKSLLVVDVRSKAEIDSSGSIPVERWTNIPVADFKTSLECSETEFKNKYGQDKPKCDGSDLIINCGSGKRSAIALKEAINIGYTKARHYPGGFMRWMNEQGTKK